MGLSQWLLTTTQERELEKVNTFYLQKEAEVSHKNTLMIMYQRVKSSDSLPA
jgi:hypothetical protein